LGSKGAVLNEADRTEEALPVLERCLELFLQVQSGPESLGDVALARVNVAASLSGVGRPRDALDQIGKANALLESVSGDDVEEAERSRQSAIRTHLFMQRGEALVEVGHPLLASDEFSRTIDLYEELLDTDDEGEAQYEARLRLPLALLRRARCWVSSGSPEHSVDALRDLRRAQRLYAGLLREEARPEHRRRLREVRELQRKLKK
jgi:tetratricopeptide (TPR) repeat protein